jgi:hypothetical protein
MYTCIKKNRKENFGKYVSRGRKEINALNTHISESGELTSKIIFKHIFNFE